MLFSWAQLGFKRRFLAFFMLGSIIPLLLFSFLFLHNTKAILQERNRELLETGLLFSREIILDELGKLELTANQLASLSVSEWYKHSYNQKKYNFLQTKLNQQLKSKDIDLLVVLNHLGKPVAISQSTDSGTNHSELFSLPGIRNLIHKAQQGETVSDLEAFHLSPGKDSTLGLITATPLGKMAFDTDNRAVLLMVKDMRRLESHSDFSRMPANLHMRVLRFHRGKLAAIINRFIPDDATHFWSIPLITSLQSGEIFREASQGISYNSLAWPLRNKYQQTLGYLVISISKENLNALINQNNIYIILYLLVAIVLVTALGSWFNRTFITPINAIAQISEQVASGDLDARVLDKAGYQEMDRTLQNFNQMLDQLQEKEGLRKTFVSTLTHDLRTPLIAQKRALEFLKSCNLKTLDVESINLLEGLHQSHDHLLAMVNDLLEVFQYEAGQISLSLKSTHLHQFVQSCLDNLAPIALQKNIKMINQVPKTFKLLVDTRQLRRVIVNLVGNSLENIQEHAEITVKAELEGPDVLIRIQDNGPGIPESLLPHLFKRYPGSHERQQKIGFGLGLYICNMIVTLHGGYITVNSKQNEGTEFLIHLPNVEENGDEQ